MATSTTKKLNAILQISHLKQLMKRWKTRSLMHIRHIPSGFLPIYVGESRMKFLIPTRFLNLPIFSHLLNIAEEEYGFNFSGGIVLPCEVHFFKQVLKFLEKDEKKYGSLDVHDFLKFIREMGFDSSSCKGKESKHCPPSLMPSVHKVRV